MIRLVRISCASGALLSVSAVADDPAKLEIAPVGGGLYELSWVAKEQRPYQLMGAPDLTSWQPIDEVVVGTGGVKTVEVTGNRSKYFYSLVEGAVRPGFDGISLVPNDDESYRGDSEMPVPVPLGFEINFYGELVSECYVNNNGNITFGSSLKKFTPSLFGTQDEKIIAPFWADVDTRGEGSGVVKFSSGGETVDGRAAFGVTYRNVGYYNSQDDKLNTFQVVLIDRSDVAVGAFDIEFNFNKVLWETGSASEGVDGYGGMSARSGVANGGGLYFEYQGSGEVSAFLDTDPETGETSFDSGLIYQQYNSSVPGRIVLPVRDGEVDGTFELSAGNDIVLDEDAGSKVQLQGFVGDGVAYSWSQAVGSEEAEIDLVDALSPTVTIPRPGLWEFKLTGVRQGTVEVTACDSVLVYHPGFFDVYAGADVEVSGDGGPVTVLIDDAYAVCACSQGVEVVWEQVLGATATIIDPSAEEVEVVLPETGTYRFKMTGTTTHDASEGAFTESGYVDVEYQLEAAANEG